MTIVSSVKTGLDTELRRSDEVTTHALHWTLQDSNQITSDVNKTFSSRPRPAYATHGPSLVQKMFRDRPKRCWTGEIQDQDQDQDLDLY